MKIIVFIILALCLPWTATAATYKGKNIDGKRYKAVASHSDGGSSSADVRFEGKIVYVYFETWTHKLFLEKIEIDDPRNVKAGDGIHAWVIEIHDSLD